MDQLDSTITMVKTAAEPEPAAPSAIPQPGEMDPAIFAQKMLELGELYSKSARLEAELEPEVLAQGKTQIIGYVTAKFSAGRTTYDWEATAKARLAVLNVDEASAEELLGIYTTTQIVTTTDWRKLADYLGTGIYKPNAPAAVVVNEPKPSVRFEFKPPKAR